MNVFKLDFFSKINIVYDKKIVIFKELIRNCWTKFRIRESN